MGKRYKLVAVLITVAGLLALYVFQWSNRSNRDITSRQVLLPDQGCTVFYGVDGETILAGNNEDFINPLTNVWFHPAENGRFGWVAFGFDDLTPQGMVNDQGLFYDGLALPYKAFRPSNKPAPAGGIIRLVEEVFETSSTVEQVQELLGQYTLDGLQTGQLFFGDRFGHSLIIDGDEILPIEGKFQVAANFRQVEFPTPPYPSDRYNRAASMLSAAGAYSIDLFRDILNAVHQEGETPTQYSQVYDLKNGLIYLYQFHDFEHVVVLDIARELAKGPHSASIVSLFPKNEAREQFAFQPLLQYRVNAESLADGGYDPRLFNDFIGDYWDESESSEQKARVFLEAGNLYLQQDGLPALRLYPLGHDIFIHPYFYHGTETRIQFQRGPLGQVSGLDRVFQVEAFGIRQLYHLEKEGSFIMPYTSWIVIGIGAAGILAAGAVFILRRRRT